MILKINEQKLKQSNIVLGILVIFFGIIVLSILNISLEATLIILSITLFTIAFVRILNSFSDKTLNLPLIILKVITSFISILLAIMIIFIISPNPLINIEDTLIVYGLLFILIGVERIISAIILKDLIKGFRIVLMIIGAIIAILSIIILIFTFLDYLISIYTISFILILSGLAKILHGIYLNK